MQRLFLVPLALIMFATLAVADEGHHAHDAKHGGIVVHSGHHHVELVVNGAAVEVFVSGEEGAAEDIAAAKASATVLVDGKAEMVTLAPAGASLKGVRAASEGKVTTVVVSLTMPGHEPEQVRFQLD